MLKKILSLVFVGVVFICSAAIVHQALAISEPSGSAQAIKKLTVDVPLTLDEAARKVIAEKLNSMADVKFVYLDLSIKFAFGRDGTRPYNLMLNGRLNDGDHQKVGKGGCQIGTLPMGPGLTYEFGPIANNNHLLISVYTGDRSMFPYNDVSCEYAAPGDYDDFRVRGFFHIVANSIPTAIGLQLRPFNPPFAVAQKVLQQP